MRLIIFCEKSFNLKKGLENIGFSENSNLIESHSFSQVNNDPLFASSEKRKRIKHLIDSEFNSANRTIITLSDYDFQTWNLTHEKADEEEEESYDGYYIDSFWSTFWKVLIEMIENTKKISFLEENHFLPVLLPGFCEYCKESEYFELEELIFQTEPKWYCPKCFEVFFQLQNISEPISAKNKVDTAAFITKDNTTWIHFPHNQLIAIEFEKRTTKKISDSEFQKALTDSHVVQTYSKHRLKPWFFYFLAFISLFDNIFTSMEDWYYALETRENYRNQSEIQENIIYSKSHQGFICKNSYFSNSNLLIESKKEFTLKDFVVKDGNYELKSGNISQELIGKPLCYNKKFLDKILNILQSNNDVNSLQYSLFITLYKYSNMESTYSSLLSVELEEFGCSFCLYPVGK